MRSSPIPEFLPSPQCSATQKTAATAISIARGIQPSPLTTINNSLYFKDRTAHGSIWWQFRDQKSRPYARTWTENEQRGLVRNTGISVERTPLNHHATHSTHPVGASQSIPIIYVALAPELL
ncbi:hypothetical protein PM082_007544 [Marasmius tenuissimus]|nr:hypothetical protein PM082_007544 [Marasmius tenuissimus]